MWIYREISSEIQKNHDLIQILRGPRQCGKSSLLLRLDSEFTEVSLDDPALRELAQSDPELFLKQFGSTKLLIDEAQYAPALFISLKRRVDLAKRSETGKLTTLYRITGSNQILMDRNVKESLAGRASYFDLNTLSVSEILSTNNTSIQDILYMGGWPELHANPANEPKKFLDNYINSYVEKDIVLTAGIQKSREFLKFVRMLAGRVGTLLDLTGLGRDCGVDSKTVKDWISVLERMNLISLVEPFFTNLSTRLIKTPKIYFLDTGLACRLQGWTSAEPIMTSPQQGGLFENLVYAELFKLNQNRQLSWRIFHWRSRAGEELDFLVERGPQNYIFIEAKVTAPKSLDRSKLVELKKVFGKNIPRIVVCHQEGDRVLGDNVPLAKLAEFITQES